MKSNDFSKQLTKFIMKLEVVLAVCLAIGILIGITDILRYLALIFQTDIAEGYAVFKKFLGFTLLLVVGIELVLMLLSHSNSAVLQLVLYAIARKMLIYSETMLDLILGTAAIAGVFAIKKYLMVREIHVNQEGYVFSAGEAVQDVNINTGLHLPENIGQTIGGVVCNLSEETCIPVEEGAQYETGNIQIKIVKMRDGLIQKVLLKEKEYSEKQHAN
ncbi:MAG: hypothetical protein JJT76_08100 [Clostridiaceae bacterium]|nr:hypothetical protein [Clostridiaceae bacterium]